LRIRNFRVKISEFYEIFKIRKIRLKKTRFIASLVSAKFSNSHNTLAVNTEATVEWKQWQ